MKHNQKNCNNPHRVRTGLLCLGTLLSIGLCSTLAPLAMAQDATSAAAPTVLFNAQTNAFTYQNATAYTGEENLDLFPTLKSVVPGDTLTQPVVIGVQNLPQGTQVALYLSAENPNDDYQAFTTLQDVQLTVRDDAGADITGNLDTPLLLATFTENETVTVTVQLAVPLSIGAELSTLEGKIDWVLQVQTTQDATSGTATPAPQPTQRPGGTLEQTGQTQWGWLAVALLMLGCLFAGYALWYAPHKQETEEQTLYYPDGKHNLDAPDAPDA